MTDAVVAPPSRQAHWAWIMVAIFGVGLAMGLAFAPRVPDSYDSGIMLQVAENLFQHGSVHVTTDYLGLNTPHASFGLATSLGMGVLFELGRAVGVDSTAAAMTVNAWLFGLLLAALVALGRVLGYDPLRATVGALLVGVGTPLFVVTGTGFSELGVAVGLALGLVGVALMSRGGEQRLVDRGAALAGFASSVALLFRSDSAVLIAFPILIGVVLATSTRIRAVIAYAIGAVPVFGAWLAYNAVRYGAPWRLGYANSGKFNHPEVRGIVDSVVSPTHGLLWYTPILIGAVFGVRAAARRWPVLCVVGALALGLRVVIFARWWGWYGGGGWGPRLLVPALPVLLLPILVLLERRVRSWSVVVLALSALVSVWFQLVGSAVATNNLPSSVALGRELPHFSSGPAGTRYDASRAGQDKIDPILMRWSLQPFTFGSKAFVHRQDRTDSLWAGQGNNGEQLAVGLLFLISAGALIGSVRPVRSRPAAD
jgi:hypothetical protein